MAEAVTEGAKTRDLTITTEMTIDHLATTHRVETTTRETTATVVTGDTTTEGAEEDARDLPVDTDDKTRILTEEEARAPMDGHGTTERLVSPEGTGSMCRMFRFSRSQMWTKASSTGLRRRSKTRA